MVEDVTGRFGAWVNEHFQVDADCAVLVCRRCEMTVGYLTKHAAVRHGDQIRIMPIIPAKLGIISVANAF